MSDHRQLLRDAITASCLSARGFARRLGQPCECCGHTPLKSPRAFWRWLASEEPITLPDAVVHECERVLARREGVDKGEG